MTRKRMTPKQIDEAVKRFNERAPVGSRVRVCKGQWGTSPSFETVVAAPGAFNLGGHTAVVKVPGDSISLTHVEIL